MKFIYSEKCILLLSIMCFIFSLGCQEKTRYQSSPIDIVKDLELNNFVTRFQPYQVDQVTRGVDRVYIKFPDGAEYFFSDFDVNDSTKFRITYASSIGDDFIAKHFKNNSPIEQNYLNKGFNVLKEFERHKIMSFRTVEDVIKIRTSEPYLGKNLGTTSNLYYVLLYSKKKTKSLNRRITNDLLIDPIIVNKYWHYSVYEKKKD